MKMIKINDLKKISNNKIFKIKIINNYLSLQCLIRSNNNRNRFNYLVGSYLIKLSQNYKI